jgi:hypothetical protein
VRDRLANEEATTLKVEARASEGAVLLFHTVTLCPYTGSS